MTKLASDKPCESCGGLLVPPDQAHAPAFKVQKDADYVCLNCGRPYRWVGNPPKLTTVFTATPADEKTEDDY